MADIAWALGPTVLAAAFGAFIGGLARGFSGFGAALIFVPVASAALGPRIAAPTFLAIDALLPLVLIPAALKHCDWREIIPLCLFASIGIPVGAWLLFHLDPVIIRWAIALVIGALLPLMAAGITWPNPPRILTAPVGFLSGVFGGAAQITGPPVILYWLGKQVAPSLMRANLLIFFQYCSFVTAATYTVRGLWTAEVLIPALVMAPTYLIGIMIGARLFPLAPQSFFRKVTYALIAFAAITSLPLLDPLLR